MNKLLQTTISLLLSATLLTSCNKEDIKQYHGTAGNYYVNVLETPGTNKITISDNTGNTMYAIDSNNDREYDELYFENVSTQSPMRTELTPKKVSQLHNYIELKELCKPYKSYFEIVHDTLIKDTANGIIYGISDLDKDGDFDVIESVGSYTIHYDIKIREDYQKSCYFPSSEKISKEEFSSQLESILSN